LSSVADPNPCDADPDPAFHFDPDPDPDPTFHFDVDSDPDPCFQIKACHLQIDTDPDSSFNLMRIRCGPGSTSLLLR
jgi:hypothetical protein